MDYRVPKRWQTQWAAAALVLAAFSTACGPSGQPKTAASATGLAPYTAQAATLFDDSIAPEIFGASLSGSSAANNPDLASWTQRAESVMPVRISTVTSDSEGNNPIYTLVLRPTGPPLAGRSWTGSISIEIEPMSPSYPFVHSADSTLVGKEFILFIRRYEQQGRTTIHWRGEADTRTLRAAVERARLVGGLR